MTADYTNPLTLPAYEALSEGAYALDKIRRQIGEKVAEDAKEMPFDDLLVLAVGHHDPGVCRTMLMKSYESAAAKQIPGWEPVYC